MSEFPKKIEQGQANSGLDEDSASKIHREFIQKKYHLQGPEQGPSPIDTKKIYDGLFAEHRQLIDRQIECGQLRLEALQSFARQLGMKEKAFPESLPDMRSENAFLKKIRTVFDAQTDHFDLASLHELQKAATDYASMRADQKEIYDMIDELFIRMKNSGALVARRTEWEEALDETPIEQKRQDMLDLEKEVLSSEMPEKRTELLREVQAARQEIEVMVSLRTFYEAFDEEQERSDQLKRKAQEKGFADFTREKEPMLQGLVKAAEAAIASKDTSHIEEAINRLDVYYREVEAASKKNFPLLFPKDESVAVRSIPPVETPKEEPEAEADIPMATTTDAVAGEELEDKKYKRLLRELKAQHNRPRV
jgi:hypothetical protein